jgi:hypothetical protein
MKTQEISYSENAEPTFRMELEELMQQSSTLEELIEYWCVEKGRSLNIGVVFDDTYNVIEELIEIEFQHPETKEECACVYISRLDVVHGVVAPVLFDSFITGERKSVTGFLDLDDHKLNSWLGELGFEDSEALYARVGPKSAILPVVVAFALSMRGAVCISQANCDSFEDEDIAEELEREGLDMHEHLSLSAIYFSQPRRGMVGRLCFDMIYCSRKPEAVDQECDDKKGLIA